MIKKTNLPKLSRNDKVDILFYLKHEVLPHIFDSCIPVMKDVSEKDRKFTKIWSKRQEVLYKQALEMVVKEIQKEI